MRRLLLAIALLLVLPAPASAQVPDDEPLALVLAPWPATVAPLQTPVTTDWTIEVSCTLLVGRPTGAQIDLSIMDAPSWATLVVQPPSVTADFSDCENQRVVLSGQLLASASDLAPAFTPAPVHLRAEATDLAGETVSAEADAPLTASYFGILDVAAAKVMARVAPGEPVAFPINLTNYGNGPARVDFEVDGAESMIIDAMPPLLLQSRHEGDGTIHRETELRLTAPDAPRVFLVTVWINGTYASDHALGPTHDVLTFQVEVVGAAEAASEEARNVPAPAAGVLVALALAAVGRKLRARH